MATDSRNERPDPFEELQHAAGRLAILIDRYYQAHGIGNFEGYADFPGNAEQFKSAHGFNLGKLPLLKRLQQEMELFFKDAHIDLISQPSSHGEAYFISAEGLSADKLNAVSDRFEAKLAQIMPPPPMTTPQRPIREGSLEPLQQVTRGMIHDFRKALGTDSQLHAMVLLARLISKCEFLEEKGRQLIEMILGSLIREVENTEGQRPVPFGERAAQIDALARKLDRYEENLREVYAESHAYQMAANIL